MTPRTDGGFNEKDFNESGKATSNEIESAPADQFDTRAGRSFVMPLISTRTVQLVAPAGRAVSSVAARTSGQVVAPNIVHIFASRPLCSVVMFVTANAPAADQISVLPAPSATTRTFAAVTDPQKSWRVEDPRKVTAASPDHSPAHREPAVQNAANNNMTIFDFIELKTEGLPPIDSLLQGERRNPKATQQRNKNGEAEDSASNSLQCPSPIPTCGNFASTKFQPLEF